LATIEDCAPQPDLGGIADCLLHLGVGRAICLGERRMRISAVGARNLGCNAECNQFSVLTPKFIPCLQRQYEHAGVGPPP
jgi:hypothetical protein